MRSKSSVIPFFVLRRKVWLAPTARVPCSNAANIEGKTWKQSTWLNSVRGQEPPKMYTSCTSPEDCQTSCKVWLTSVERRRCSNEARSRNRLKFSAVSQTRQAISAVSGPKFTILLGHMEQILLFRPTKFLANENSRTSSLFAVARPSVCRLFVCLSVCRLSVCNARAPYSGGCNFRQVFCGIWYLGRPLTCTENFMEIVSGEPLRRGS